MSEVKKIATRASYGSALVELGKEHDDLVVLDADLGSKGERVGYLGNHRARSQYPGYL